MKGSSKKVRKLKTLPRRVALVMIRADEKHCGDHCSFLRDSGFSTMRGALYHCILFDASLEKNPRRKKNRCIRTNDCLEAEGKAWVLGELQKKGSKKK